MFVGEANDWPYLRPCCAVEKTRFNELLIESKNFCESNNIPSFLMTPSLLPSRYFQGLDYQKLSFDLDGWHFDASGVVPLQRYLEVAIYKLVKKRTEQSALHSV